MIELTVENIAKQVRANIGLLTEEETAAVLQLNSTDTLATWRSQKKGPPSIKLGKRVFYSVKDMAEWINNVGKEQHAARQAAA